MIERYVFLRFHDAYATAEGRREAAEHARRVLPTIPGVTAVRVGIPADDSSEGRWDLSLAITLESLDAFVPYRDHPIHRAFADDFMGPRVSVRKAWNFAVAPGHASK